MKYSDAEYAISESYESQLRERKALFSSATLTKKAVHTIMVTTYGLRPNAYSWSVQGEVTMDDLFL